MNSWALLMFFRSFEHPFIRMRRNLLIPFSKVLLRWEIINFCLKITHFYFFKTVLDLFWAIFICSLSWKTLKLHSPLSIDAVLDITFGIFIILTRNSPDQETSPRVDSCLDKFSVSQILDLIWTKKEHVFVFSPI